MPQRQDESFSLALSEFHVALVPKVGEPKVLSQVLARIPIRILSPHGRGFQEPGSRQTLPPRRSNASDNRATITPRHGKTMQTRCNDNATMLSTLGMLEEGGLPFGKLAKGSKKPKP